MCKLKRKSRRELSLPLRVRSPPLVEGVVGVSRSLPQGMSSWARVHSRSAVPGRSWGMVGHDTPRQGRVACSSWGRAGWPASRRTAAARAMLDLVGVVMSSRGRGKGSPQAWQMPGKGRTAWQSPQWSAANSGTPAAADSWHPHSGELAVLGHQCP